MVEERIAAEQLSADVFKRLSANTLAKRLKDLSAQLGGVELIERRKKSKGGLTAEGKTLLREVKEYLASCEA